MVRPGWNHNIDYHGVVLGFIPRPRKRALDVGWGEGFSRDG
jgi:hypothetical protein